MSEWLITYLVQQSQVIWKVKYSRGIALVGNFAAPVRLDVRSRRRFSDYRPAGNDVLGCSAATKVPLKPKSVYAPMFLLQTIIEDVI